MTYTPFTSPSMIILATKTAPCDPRTSGLHRGRGEWVCVLCSCRPTSVHMGTHRGQSILTQVTNAKARNSISLLLISQIKLCFTLFHSVINFHSF